MVVAGVFLALWFRWEWSSTNRWPAAGTAFNQATNLLGGGWTKERLRRAAEGGPEGEEFRADVEGVVQARKNVKRDEWPPLNVKMWMQFRAPQGVVVETMWIGWPAPWIRRLHNVSYEDVARRERPAPKVWSNERAHIWSGGDFSSGTPGALGPTTERWHHGYYLGSLAATLVFVAGLTWLGGVTARVFARRKGEGPGSDVRRWGRIAGACVACLIVGIGTVDRARPGIRVLLTPPGAQSYSVSQKPDSPMVLDLSWESWVEESGSSGFGKELAARVLSAQPGEIGDGSVLACLMANDFGGFRGSMRGWSIGWPSEVVIVSRQDCPDSLALSARPRSRVWIDLGAVWVRLNVGGPTISTVTVCVAPLSLAILAVMGTWWCARRAIALAHDRVLARRCELGKCVWCGYEVGHG